MTTIESVAGSDLHELRSTPRVLLVEDDRSLAASMAMGLDDDGFSVTSVHNFADGFQHAMTAGADLFILDVVLGDRTGIELAEALRAHGVGAPILMLTARGDTATMIDGLAFADDYVVKPVSLDVLSARLGALQRRWHHNDGEVLRVGDLELRRKSLTVERSGTSFDLTPAQAQVLAALMTNAGSILTRAQICDWLDNGNPCSNVVDVHIRSLRMKIDEPFESTWIQTIRGAGYRVGCTPVPR